MTAFAAAKNGQEHRELRIGEWLVQPSLTRIERAGNEVRLEPRVMDLLVFLAERPGQLVSREALEQAVWTGSVVSYDALTGAIQKLRKALDDDPRRPRYIETVSKKGYRLISPVSIEVHTGAGNGPAPARERAPAWRQHLLPAAGGGLVILLLAIAGILLMPDRSSEVRVIAPASAASNSIAVLPFDNLSRDPQQEYFSDGITDDLITGLAKHPDLLVIARDSTFMYRDRAADLALVAERLNVRYILQGSVQRNGKNVRINARLVDGRKGALAWAESYNGNISDIFTLQDRITGQIVTALTERLGSGKPARASAVTQSTQAYENFLMGRKHFYLYDNRDENRRARDLFLTSIRYDESFAMAWAMLAWTHVFDVMNGWSEDRVQSLEEGLSYATKALELDDALPVAYWVRGLAYREMGEYVKALVEAEHAIDLDPNYANAHVLLATLLYFAGRPEEGLEKMRRAMQINPHHPFNYTLHLGQAYFILHRYQEAVDALRTAADSNPASERIHVWLAAALARNNAPDDAEWEAIQVQTLNPDFSLQRLQESLPFKDPADRQHFIASLRMAGLK